MFTIVGSGFGLYGYLPALIESLGGPVLLPMAYQDKVSARPELARYRDAIHWVADTEAALAAADGVVVASTPMRQPELVAQCLRLPSLKFLVLEKPLAATPAMAADVLGVLMRSGKRVRIGYTLLYTSWATRLRVPDVGHFDGQVSVSWTFMAHHFSNALRNWKREHAQGGGVLRFFGIHVIALLVRLGYREVAESTLIGEDASQPEQWRAVFSGAYLPDCRVLVDSRSPANDFRVALDSAAGSTVLIDLREPFQPEEPVTPQGDRRVGILKRLLQTFQSDDADHYSFYHEVNRLWQSVEDGSTFTNR
jgi:predicted dehydrogenase